MHDVAARCLVKLGDAVRVRLAHHTLDIRAELDRCALDGISVLIHTDDAVRGAGNGSRGLFAGEVQRTGIPKERRLCIGGSAALLPSVEQRLKRRFILVDLRAHHGAAEDSALAVDKIARRESLEIKKIIEIGRAGDARIVSPCILKKLSGRVYVLLGVAVKEQADNAAAHLLETFMDLRKFTEFTLAEAASGLPDVQHGDPVGGKELLAADGIAVKVGGLETDAGSGEIGVRILGFIIVCTVDDVIRVLQQLVVQADLIRGEAVRQNIRSDGYVMGLGSDRRHLIDLTARNHGGKLRIVQNTLVTVFPYTQEGQI